MIFIFAKKSVASIFSRETALYNLTSTNTGR